MKATGWNRGVHTNQASFVGQSLRGYDANKVISQQNTMEQPAMGQTIFSYPETVKPMIHSISSI